MRIVSLIPSATEIVCALGLRQSLVGRSHECDFPVDVDGLPALTRARISLAGDSAAISRSMARALEDAVAIYEVDAPLLDSLRPDLIVTQDQCEVCAASLLQVEAALCARSGRDVAIVSLKPSSVAEAMDDIMRVGRAAGIDATPLVTQLRARMAETSAVTSARRPRLLYVEWIEPIMGPGLWTPELIAMAGAEPVGGVAGRHARWLTWDEVAAGDPDLVVIAPCGFDLARGIEESAALRRSPVWCNLRAVREGRVAVADGNAFFNRPGPRLAESLQILREVVSGSAGPHFGVNWRWLASV
ncbi:MAG: ABC transporter substrate-binding protein [Alphaproteobacteria bacterium]|nr:ABC transporter substrate-binding protein [Alphaproteobacteria bacterium]